MPLETSDPVDAQARHGGHYGAPYTAKHPVPTVQAYRERQAQRKSPTGDSNASEESSGQAEVYPVTNRNWADRSGKDRQADDANEKREDQPIDMRKAEGRDSEARPQSKHDANGAPPSGDSKPQKAKHGGREVTDPVTHLPISIHDMTARDLKTAPENEPSAGSTAKSSTGLSGATKGEDQLASEKEEMDRGYRGMRQMFPSPVKRDFQVKLVELHKQGAMIGLAVVTGTAIIGVVVASILPLGWLATPVVLSATAAVAYFLALESSGWVENKVNTIFQDETWDAARQEEKKVHQSDAELPESVGWLNGMLSSVWPLINPDLFISLADTLEDVMQASLPGVIRMVSIDDLGQGSEAIRILGIRWLPTGAAAQSVDQNGKLKKAGEGNDDDSRKTGDVQEGVDDTNGQVSEATPESGNPGDDLEAEEGDFVNVELAFAYRARSTGRSVQTKAKNAHLYLKFYLPGGIVVPVWVELRGVIGIMRLRLQLTPDPPFFSLCTLTFLGQPQVDMSCVPLSKHSPNIMDVPFISRFVQQSVDAALAEYVAPKSLALNLKDMLMGDEAKKDTEAIGVILVYIKRARGYKQGDGDIGPMHGSSDTFATVSWGKFGKPVASTRIIVDSQEPNWNEWASILVTSEELNAEETLRLQIWDSDKYTADDDLGRVELPLKELIRDPKTKNQHCEREDGLRGDDEDEKMPGTLTWSVGYFAKTRIQQDQLDNQTAHPDIRSTEQLHKWASETAAAKLRESGSAEDGSDERHQQTGEDLKEKEDEMITQTQPPRDYPSGVLSVQIHNITGLEISRLNKRKAGDKDDEDETEEGHDLPDSYCTIIINHRKVYRTRTKPKDAKPFFNAGTEKFVPDWRTGEAIISVRDRRDHENDPLLGVVYLPLRRVFEKHSQVMKSFPIAGGIGHGRARISLVWRSVECKLPKEIMGWDYGTLEVKPLISGKGITDGKVKQCSLHVRTPIGRAKMKPSEGGVWHPKRGSEESQFLAVAKRYRTPLILEFRQASITGDRAAAVAVLWLNEIPDEEEKQVSVKVWKGGKDQMARAQSCADYEGLEEGEQPLGEVELTVKFWRGLSGYHKRYAGRPSNAHVRDVMEVLDTVNGEDLTAEDKDGVQSDTSDSDSESSPLDGSGDGQSNEEKRKMLRKADTGSSSSDSGNESDDNEDAHGLPTRVKKKVLGDTNRETDGRRDARAQINDFRANRKQLHRKHRGIMQWKATRTLDWMAGKVSLGKGKIGEAVKHSDKDGGLETEV